MAFSPKDMYDNLDKLVEQAEKYVDGELAKQDYMVGRQYKIVVNKFTDKVLRILIEKYKKAGWDEVSLKDEISDNLSAGNYFLVLISRGLGSKKNSEDAK